MIKLLVIYLAFLLSGSVARKCESRELLGMLKTCVSPVIQAWRNSNTDAKGLVDLTCKNVDYFQLPHCLRNVMTECDMPHQPLQLLAMVNILKFACNTKTTVFQNNFKCLLGSLFRCIKRNSYKSAWESMKSQSKVCDMFNEVKECTGKSLNRMCEIAEIQNEFMDEMMEPLRKILHCSKDDENESSELSRPEFSDEDGEEGSDLFRPEFSDRDENQSREHSSRKLSKGVLIGIIVGGPVVGMLLLVVIVAVCIKFRRKPHVETEGFSNPNYLKAPLHSEIVKTLALKDEKPKNQPTISEA